MKSPIQHDLISRKLKACMKPNPQYRERRLAQFDEARKARYHANVRAVFGEAG